MNIADLTSLNDRLQSTGYPSFPAELLSIGGGGHSMVAGPLLIGGEGYGVVVPSRGVQGRTVSLGGGYGLLTLGYQLPLTERLHAIPIVGVGGGGLSLEIGSATGNQFDDVLRDPNRAATLEKGMFLVSIGAGVQYRFFAGHTGGYHLGLRAGYLLAPYAGDWAVNERRLSGGPDATFTGSFVRFLLGGWGNDEKR